MRKLITFALFTAFAACSQQTSPDAAGELAGTYQVKTLKYNGDVYRFTAATLEVSARGTNKISLDALSVDGLPFPMVGAFGVSKNASSEIILEGGRGLYQNGTLSLKLDFTTGNGKANLYDITATK